VRLHNEANRGRAGSLIRDAGRFHGFRLGSDWRRQAQASAVESADGRAVGYLVWDKSDTDVKAVEAEAGDPRAYAAILAELARLAVEKRCEEAELFLPADHPLLVFARRYGCRCHASYNRMGGGMMRILNQQGLFEKLGPALEGRLQDSALAGRRVRLRLETDLGVTRLLLNPDGRGELRATLKTPQDKLMQLIVGYRPAADLLAQDGIEAQRRFDADKAALGDRLLQQLRDSGSLGVVLLSRSYNSQDSGANLGIAEKLAGLGVVPIPMDLLPLASVPAKQYSDRPYWFYESKYIAAADIVARDPRLYGLVLTNFGCGPNSFILRIVEDIMGGKPLGQLEIDEHAAEAGIVTRLEAFVDTIKGFARSARQIEPMPKEIYRGTTPPMLKITKTFLVPRMAPHMEVMAAAMEAYGAKVLVLPEPDERNLLYSNKVTSGTECLPYRVTLGDFMRYFYENGSHNGHVEGFMAGAYGPCRFGKYAIEQMKALRDIGFNLRIQTTVSNNGYRDFGLGAGFERLAWKCLVAVDHLERLARRARPYEKWPGAADRLFTECIHWAADRVRRNEPFDDALRQATAQFKALIDPEQPRRPLVGINGEIYLRSNRFSNADLVKVCEAAGLEVVVSSIAEWINYISYRNLEDATRDRKLKKIIVSYLRKRIQERDEEGVASNFHDLLKNGEPSTGEILALCSNYLSTKCGSEAVLSIGTGIDWMEDPQFAGVISVMPHGCMPGGIVASMSEKLAATYHKPWISLTYDGFPETNNLQKINSFAEIIRFCQQNSKAQAAGTRS
jgi:predicted nucleotide-binding protein (sugar kinase/HSP70/actin superfamily)